MSWRTCGNWIGRFAIANIEEAAVGEEERVSAVADLARRERWGDISQTRPLYMFLEGGSRDMVYLGSWWCRAQWFAGGWAYMISTGSTTPRRCCACSRHHDEDDSLALFIPVLPPPAKGRIQLRLRRFGVDWCFPILWQRDRQVYVSINTKEVFRCDCSVLEFSPFST